MSSPFCCRCNIDYLQLVKVEENDYDIIFVDQYMASTTKQLLGTETTRELRAKGCNSVICKCYVRFRQGMRPSVLLTSLLLLFLHQHRRTKCQRFRIAIFRGRRRWLYHEAISVQTGTAKIRAVPCGKIHRTKDEWDRKLPKPRLRSLSNICLNMRQIVDVAHSKGIPYTYGYYDCMLQDTTLTKNQIIPSLYQIEV